jgi:aryl-alcohol dehydrogenase-like predicted oxidoreductase
MTVPSLGFGTAAIMGRISRRRGLAALERAHAAGIRHFDTARSYGWGEAERVVGAFLRGHAREDIRLVTKCGIVPVRRSAMLQAAKTMARLALSLAPGLRARGRQIATNTGFRPTYTADPEALAASLRTSLGELGVSYVDVLLLHNFSPGMARLEEVAAWFAGLKQSGVIRQHGFSVEGGLNEGLSFLARQNLLAGAVIQAPVSEAMLNLPEEWRDVPIIAHSPFEFLRAQSRITSFADLLRAVGETCRCEALVCSMFSPDHLAANVEAWRKSK